MPQAFKSDDEIITDAMEFARENRTRIANQFVNLAVYPSEDRPWTVFMAGSPGAGKTEVSKGFEAALEELPNEGFEGLGKVLRIDPDDFRIHFPDYNGRNSSLFNSAVTKIVEKVVDRAFAKSVSFILDGTLSSDAVARKNIDRSLRRERDVTLLYVYQDPLRAWQFVQSREAVEGRNIPLQAFVAQYFSCRRTVKAMKLLHGPSIRVDLLIQARDGQGQPTVIEDVSAAAIDAAIPDTYSEEQLLQRLSRGGGDDNE